MVIDLVVVVDEYVASMVVTVVLSGLVVVVDEYVVSMVVTGVWCSNGGG